VLRKAHSQQTRDSERSQVAEMEARAGELTVQLEGPLAEAAQSTRAEANASQDAIKAARDGVEQASRLIESAESGVGAQGGLQQQLMVRLLLPLRPLTPGHASPN
jgi:hypothetical protein